MSGPIVMAHALAELRYGIVAHQHESGFKCGYISAQTLYDLCVCAVVCVHAHADDYFTRREELAFVPW